MPASLNEIAFVISLGLLALSSVLAVYTSDIKRSIVYFLGTSIILGTIMVSIGNAIMGIVIAAVYSSMCSLLALITRMR
ncbi:MAG: hypothetical protein LBT03_00735 [Holosporales bacterium]|nr:hypothetical protein [Holosporales bacterium]